MHRPALRLLPILCALTLLAPAAASGQAPDVSRTEAVEALRAVEAVFTDQLAAGGGASRGATAALRDLAIALPELRGAQRSRAESFLTRPTDDGRAYFGREAKFSPICSPDICVHWTNKKQNAPDSPEFIREVITATNLSHEVETGPLRFRAPKPDAKRGAREAAGRKGQVDVYITNLGPGLYGYAAPDPDQEGQRRHAYLVLDNNYVGFPSPPLDSMRATVAHEYNHILQFNYDTFQDLWFFESSATWSEEQVYPDNNDYLNYLPAFAGGSRFPLTGDGIKIYSAAVWNHWLSSRYGLGIVQDAWAASSAGVQPKHLATAAYTEAIRANGGRSFSSEFGTFAAATAEWNSSTSFPDAGIYPGMRRTGTLGRKPQEVELDNTSYRLVDVKLGNGPISLRVKAPRRTSSAIALVGREGGLDEGTVTTDLEQLGKGGVATVTLPDPGRFTRITAVIVNTDGRRNGVARNNRRYLGDGSVYRYELG